MLRSFWLLASSFPNWTALDPANAFKLALFLQKNVSTPVPVFPLCIDTVNVTYCCQAGVLAPGSDGLPGRVPGGDGGGGSGSGQCRHPGLPGPPPPPLPGPPPPHRQAVPSAAPPPRHTRSAR